MAIFTNQERAVLRLKNVGLTDSEIARQIGRHRGHVKRLRESAEQKLEELRDAAEAHIHGKLLEHVTGTAA